VTDIIHLEDCKLWYYRGNYDDFKEMHAQKVRPAARLAWRLAWRLACGPGLLSWRWDRVRPPAARADARRRSPVVATASRWC
jgi:hypothetical protein